MSRLKGGKFVKITSMILLFAVTLIVIASLVMVVFGGSKPEKHLVQTDRYQAVFLNGGQVYFGKVTDMNKNYVTLHDIYYLKVNQQVQPETKTSNNSNDVTLAKLGCELHGPEDLMVINHDQILFWENLKNSGQVNDAIKQFVQQNPNGQTCTTPSSSTSNQ